MSRCMSVPHDNESGYIAERETPHGYWWRYRHGDGEPGDMLEAAIMIAGEIAATEARKRGKTYYWPSLILLRTACSRMRCNWRYRYGRRQAGTGQEPHLRPRVSI